MLGCFAVCYCSMDIIDCQHVRFEMCSKRELLRLIRERLSAQLDYN